MLKKNYFSPWTMQEKNIVKISIITTILGLLFLFFLAEEVSIPPLATIESSSLQQPVSLDGVVTKLVKKDKIYFLELDATRREKINVVVFPNQDIFLQEGNIVQIQGNVQEYKGQKEIIASKIVVKGDSTATH